MVDTLESVVGPRHVAAWEEGRLQAEDSPLAKFHHKYWGVSMKEEVDEWRLREPENMNIDVDGEVEEEERDEGEDNEEDEGEDEGEDEEDIIEGCYVLNIDIEGIETSIWVRAEYIRIFNHIAELHDKLTFSTALDIKSYCVILTGQPGIGKTKFRGYAMRRCCAEERAFVLYQGEIRYLFVREGVFQAPTTFLSSQYRGFVWTLVDADEDKDAVPPKLVSQGTRHFVIFSTSPVHSRWARVHKTFKEYAIVMNPWSRKEIVRAAPLRLRDPDFHHINDVFDELGPIPRLCIEYDEKELSVYRDALASGLRSLTIGNLQKLVDGGIGLKMDAISHKICLVRRSNPTVTKFCHEVDVLPITPSVGSRITFQLRNTERSQQIRLYKTLTSLPSSKKLSGNVFEAYCQKLFSGRIKINYFPMVRLGGSNILPKKRQRRWHTSNTELAPPLLEKERIAARQEKMTFDIRPSSSFEFTSRDFAGGRKLTIKPNVYYSPAASNQEGFDSFIMHNNILYLFQFTNATTHDIKDFVDFFDKCRGHPVPKRWHFIFVIPSDTHTAMKCPVPATDALQKLALYSAEVTVE